MYDCGSQVGFISQGRHLLMHFCVPASIPPIFVWKCHRSKLAQGTSFLTGCLMPASFSVVARERKDWHTSTCLAVTVAGYVKRTNTSFRLRRRPSWPNMVVKASSCFTGSVLPQWWKEAGIPMEVMPSSIILRAIKAKDYSFWSLPIHRYLAIKFAQLCLGLQSPFLALFYTAQHFKDIFILFVKSFLKNGMMFPLL